MKLSKKVRKELLSKLGFDLGEFQLPKIDLEKLTSEPFDTTSPGAAVQKPMLSESEKDSIINAALERAVDAVLDQIIQENDPDLNKL